VLLDIKSRLTKIQSQGRIVNLIWIPSHCNINFNEAADQEARLAVKEGEPLPVPLPPREIFHHLHQKQIIHWRTHWEENWEKNCTTTSLRGPLVIPWYKKVSPNFPLNTFTPWFCKQYFARDYITLLTRLRIGHGNFPDHLHIINLRENNLCECGSIGFLDHIFFECIIHVNASAQLNLAIDLLDIRIDNPKTLTQLLQLQNKKIHDLLIQCLKNEQITL
jgi:hypothetical protein